MILNRVVINTERPAADRFVSYCSVIIDCAEDAGSAAVRINTLTRVLSIRIGRK